MRSPQRGPPCASQTCQSPASMVPSATSACSSTTSACAGISTNSCPARSHPLAGLYRRHVLDGLEVRLATREGTVVRIVVELAARVRELTLSIDRLARELRGFTESQAPTLLALDGCGPLTAAKLLGETAGVTRFRAPPPSPSPTAPRGSRCGPGTRRGIDSAVVATASSTWRSIASP